jgi:hypothetical protein
MMAWIAREQKNAFCVPASSRHAIFADLAASDPPDAVSNIVSDRLQQLG